MFPKCSLNSYSSYLQIFGLLVLVIILIIAGIYYMRIYYQNILEKYDNSLDLSYKESKESQPGDRSTFPSHKYQDVEGTTETTGDKYTFRECKVYFTENIAACDSKTDDGTIPKTCSYTFDGWQEFDTYTDSNGSNIIYPKKIFNKDISNTNKIINAAYTSKCFKEFNDLGKGNAKPFEYSENNLVRHDSKGVTGTAIDTNFFGGKKYTSIQFLSSEDASSENNFDDVISSICSLTYTDRHRELENKIFYQFILNANNTINSIKKVKLNDEQTNFSEIQNIDPIKDFAVEGKSGIRINNNKLEIFIKSSDITKRVNIYKFIYTTNLCNASKIKTFNIKNKDINLSKFINFFGCTPERRGIAKTSPIVTNIDISVLIDLLTDQEKQKFIVQNVDYREDILRLIQEKRQAKESEIIRLLKQERDIISAKIIDYERQKSLAIEQINNYVPADKTFLGVVNLKKEGSSERIFDYKQGYINKTINEYNIPQGAIVGITTYVFINPLNTSQKEYIFIVPEGTTYDCEILVVGGGGGGGSRHAGGGGGGAVIKYGIKTLHTGNYKILVGAGGKGAQSMGEGAKGEDSLIILNNNPIFLAKGGGGGNHWSTTGNNNKDGGSGGGGGNSNGDAVSATNIPSGKYGNNGGKCTGSGNDPAREWGGGGGGGAGEAGKDSEKKIGISNIEGVNDGVIVYEDAYYQGTSALKKEGNWDMNGSPGMGIRNDSLSSIKIPVGYKVTLYYHGDFDTPSPFVLTQDTPILPDGWDNVVSGFKVEKTNINLAAAGDGGDGVIATIAGVPVLVVGAGGGGGCYIDSFSNGKGGSRSILGSVGGDGSKGSEKAKDGLPLSGSGGGGGGFDSNNRDGIGGNGGSGVVIINILHNSTTEKKENDFMLFLDELYKIEPPENKENQKISIQKDILQLNCITAFVYLQKGYYRFRADIGNEFTAKAYGNPNIRSAILGIYDESTKKTNGFYDFLPVFTYISDKKPAYLKSYLKIDKNKLYKLVYIYIANNINNLAFNLWYKYSKTEPILELTYIGYSKNIEDSKSPVKSMIIGERDKYIVFPYSGQKYTFNVPSDGIQCDILIVGGGGGGGSYGGGGGGGGVRQLSNEILSSGNYLVTVGAGGAGGIWTFGTYPIGENGGTSSIISSDYAIYAAGGGGGGSYSKEPNITPTANKTSGGGGGSGARSVSSMGGNGNGISGEGGLNPGNNRGGGGGGAGGHGSISTPTGAGDGGIGLSSTITGSTLNIGGGGGGGSWTGGTPGIGRHGGGTGAVERSGIRATAGVEGTGGGGGGGGGWTGNNNANGANGGSGIVIIRYRTINLQNRIPTSLTINESNKINGLHMYESENITDINDDMNSYLFSGTKNNNFDIDIKNKNSVYQHYYSDIMREFFSEITYNNENYIENKNFSRLAKNYLNIDSINFFNIKRYDIDIDFETKKLTEMIKEEEINIQKDTIINNLNILTTNINGLYKNKRDMNYIELIGAADACLKPNTNISDIILDESDKTYNKIPIENLRNKQNLLTPNLVSSIYIEALS